MSEMNDFRDQKVKVAALIQAAGGAVRFSAERHKLLMPLKGEPVILHTIRLAQSAQLDPVVVVLGAQRELIRNVICEEPIIIVENPNWEQGQSTSLAFGLNALPKGLSGACLMLADQPFVQVSTFQKLLDAHKANPDRIIVPVFSGKRGNPTIFPEIHFDEMRQQPVNDFGGRAVLHKYGALFIEVDDPFVIRDIDTLQEYQTYKQDLEQGL